MNKAKKECKEIIQLDSILGLRWFTPEEIRNRGNEYGERYEKLNPGAMNGNDVECSQCQRNRMTDGERRDKDQNFLPVAHNVYGTERQHKEDVVIAIGIIKDMIFSQNKIELEF